MAARGRPFLVGLFLLGGVGIALVAVLWLGATDWFAKKHTYVTYFDGSVQGLNPGADVKFRGVPVGKVKEIRVAPDGSLIEVTMELRPELRVEETMRTGLGYTGITGLRYVECDYEEGEKLERHPQLTFKPPHPVIPSAPGGFEEIEESLRSIYAKLVAIDTEGLSRRAGRFLDAGTRLAVSADSLLRSQDVQGWVAKLHRTADRADSLVLGLNERLADARLDSTLAHLDEGSARFRNLMVTLDREIAHMRVADRTDTLYTEIAELVGSGRDLLNHSQYATLQIMNGLRATMTELNTTMGQLNSLVLSWETYPSNILYAAPPPPEE